MKDLRKPRAVTSIDPSLLTAGERQLRREIELLRGWIDELDAHPEHAPDAQARSIYWDMLRSREDMLDALLRQSSPQ